MSTDRLLPFYCGKCKDIFRAAGYENPVFLADIVADCPECGGKSWIHYETAYKEITRQTALSPDAVEKIYEKGVDEYYDKYRNRNLKYGKTRRQCIIDAFKDAICSLAIPNRGG